MVSPTGLAALGLAALLAGASLSVASFSPVSKRTSGLQSRAAQALCSVDPAPFGWLLGANAGALVVLASGAATAGLSTLASLAILGFSSAEQLQAGSRAGQSWLLLAAMTVPHAGFELAALAIGAAVGLSGLQLIVVVVHDDMKRLLGILRKDAMWLAIAFVLLTLGAAVECFVTPHVITTVAGC